MIAVTASLLAFNIPSFGNIRMGADPLDPATHVMGALEEAVAGAAIIRRHARLAPPGGPALTTGPDVFGAADRGDPTVVQVLEGVALDLALGIAAVAAVLDPELVVLGVGIGGQPLLAERVCAALPRVTPLSPQVAISGLGHRASLVGAVAVGLRATQESLFDVHEQPDPWTLPSIAERTAP